MKKLIFIILLLLLLLLVGCTKKEIKLILMQDDKSGEHYIHINYILSTGIEKWTYGKCEVHLKDPDFTKKTNIAIQLWMGDKK